jgi:hypothetical protein
LGIIVKGSENSGSLKMPVKGCETVLEGVKSKKVIMQEVCQLNESI